MYRSLLVALFSFLMPIGMAFGVPATISTQKVTAIAAGSATLNANVTANGFATTVTFSFRNAAGGAFVDLVGSPVVASGEVGKLVTTTVTGLTPGQTYEFRTKAVQTGGDTTAPAVSNFFLQQTDSPTLSIDERPTHIGNTATVHGTVITAGVAGDFFFEYGPTTAYALGQIGVTAIAANSTGSIDVPLTPGGATYHYRLVFENAGATLRATTADDINNRAPRAVADAEELVTIEAITIPVLTNDSDPDANTVTGTDEITLTAVSGATKGTVAIVGDEVEYTPGADFLGTDQFTYTITDSFGATATARVTVRTLRDALAGTHGGLIKKANGKENGYFTLTTNAGGSFSGIAIIDGKRYSLTGFLDADGSFKGFAAGKDGMIPVTLTTTNTDSGATITASFANGSYTAELKVDDTEATTRVDVRGRYTMGISAGGGGSSNGNDGGTPPAGSGWGALRVRDDGTAIIKGRLSDGRSYSARGTVNIEDGSPVFTFYDDPEDTRVIGTLTLGDTLTGTIHLDRHSSGEGRFPRGYDLTQNAEGARYIKPPERRRVLDTETGTKGQDLTISFTGEGLPGTITRQLFLDDGDRVTVLDRAGEGLKMKIDRNSGRFQAKVTIDTDGTRIKATGVLIQSPTGGSGSGIGTFNTSRNTGTVTISASGAAETPAPATNP